MNHRQYESTLAHDYDRSAQQYRADDECELQSENHHRLGGNIRRICRSFARPIRVLDLGCGTGRYFHWLENVEALVGVDLSAEMLKHARRPIRAEAVKPTQIRLIQGSIYEVDFPAASFDFIYSMGVFGHGASVTADLCRKLHAWLAPGGRLYFNAIEVPPTTRYHRLKRSVRQAVLPVLPTGVRAKLNARQPAVPLVIHTGRELERLMEKAGFVDFLLSSEHCRSPLWQGVHLECSARKGGVLDQSATGNPFLVPETISVPAA